MSRPKKNTKEVRVFLPPELDDWLEEVSKKRGYSKSEYFRLLLRMEWAKRGSGRGLT